MTGTRYRWFGRQPESTVRALHAAVGREHEIEIAPVPQADGTADGSLIVAENGPAFAARHQFAGKNIIFGGTRSADSLAREPEHGVREKPYFPGFGRGRQPGLAGLRHPNDSTTGTTQRGQGIVRIDEPTAPQHLDAILFHGARIGSLQSPRGRTNRRRIVRNREAMQELGRKASSQSSQDGKQEEATKWEEHWIDLPLRTTARATQPCARRSHLILRASTARDRISDIVLRLYGKPGRLRAWIHRASDSDCALKPGTPALREVKLSARREIAEALFIIGGDS